MKIETDKQREERQKMIKTRILYYLHPMSFLPSPLKYKFRYCMDMSEFFTQIPQMPLSRWQKFTRFLALTFYGNIFATKEQVGRCDESWKNLWKWEEANKQ